MKRHLYRLTIVILLTGYQIQAYGQNDTTHIQNINTVTQADSVYGWETKSWGIVAGMNYSCKLTGEIGYGKARYGVIVHHWYMSNYYFGSEFTIHDKKVILAPKASYWINGGSAGMALGLSLINYTDFSTSSLKIRPEIGIGLGKFKAVYGYNIPTFNKDFAGIGKHNFNLVVYFDLKKTDHREFK